MEELDRTRERLKKNRLSFTWLIYQLRLRGVDTEKTQLSSIFAGSRKGPKAEAVLCESKKILDDYENRMG